MKTNISQQIKSARKQLNLSQAQLAAQIDVPQQYIDRWEKGSKIAQEYLLQLQRVLGINTAPIAHQTIVNTSRPLMALPLESLPEEIFEDFCRDLLSCLEKYPAQKYGTRGDKQDGIDVLSKSGTVIQCKRCRGSFGKRKVSEAISLYESCGRQDKLKILAITKTINRSEFDTANNSGWQIWGNEEITQQVRGLEVDKQRQLMRTYFPGNTEILENCLGLESASVLISGDEFFTQYNNAKLVNYGWDYQSDGTIDKILQDIDSDNTSAIVISGSGGIGKTRLLKELTKHSSKKLLFLQEGNSLTPELALEHKGYDIIIVLDDAYRRKQDLESCLQLAGCKARILVTTRPYAIDETKSILNRRGLYSEGSHYELKPLQLPAAEKLAYEIIGQDNPTVQQLIRITKDNTFLLTLSASMLREKRILPTRVLTREDVRNFLKGYIAESFKEAKLDNDLAVSIIRITSLIQPFERGEHFTNTVKSVTNADEMKINQTLTQLLKFGILQSRHQQIRIVPDLLADYELEALLDEYPDIIPKILKQTHNTFFGNIMQNLCLLDWQTDQNKTAKHHIYKLWQELDCQYYSTNNAIERLTLLELVKKIAYYQPSKSLEFIESALEDTQNIQLEPWMTPYCIETEILQILELIAYISEFIPDVFDMLTQIADNNPKWNKSSSRTSPVKVMQDIIRPDFYKPFWYTNQVVNYILDHLFDKKHSFSPFDILETVLDTNITGFRMISQIQGESRMYKLKPEDTAEYRPQVLAKVIECLASNDLELSLRAAAAIRQIMHTQTGGEWCMETLNFLDELKNCIITSQIKPVVLAEIRLELSWTSSCSKNSSIKSATDTTIKAIETQCSEDELNLAMSILDPYGNKLFVGYMDYKKRSKDYQKWLEQLAENLISKYSNNYDELINIITSVDHQTKSMALYDACTGDAVINACCRKSKDFCIALAKVALDSECKPSYLYYSLFNLARTFKEQKLTDDLVEQAFNIGDAQLLRQIIEYVTRIGDELPTQKFQDIIYRILDLATSDNLIRLIRNFMFLEKEHQFIVIDILNNLSYGENINLTSTVVELLSFRNDDQVGVMDLSEAGREKLLTAMVHLNSIDYREQTILQNIAQNTPLRITQFLFDRIDHNGEIAEKFTYSPIPYLVRISVPISQQTQIVQTITSWIAAHPKVWYHYAEEMLRFFNIDKSIIIDALLETISLNEDNIDNIISALIASLPQTVLAEYDTVEKIVQHAKNSSKKLATYTEQALYMLAISTNGEVRSRTIGQPGQHEIWLQRIVTDGIQNDSIGQCSKRLYSSIANYAEEEMRRQEQYDQELLNE